MLLWEEYKEKHLAGVMYTQFCERYRRFKKNNAITLHIEHKAGETMQVDWAGQTMPYANTDKYFQIPGLLLEIEHAKSENGYAKFMAGLQKVKLIILDDIGLKSYSLEESRDILEIAKARYNQGFTILAGQIPHTKWYNLFPDPTIADAIIPNCFY